MQSTHELNRLPDDELLHRLVELLRHSRATEADLVAHIGEVDARRLYLREAAPSMYAYCTEVLHLSEAEAYLRIAVGRASRAHPVLLEMLADGRLHLTAVAKLAAHLTPDNREALLERATHKSKREVEELVAELEPRPDAPSSIRKLPERRVGMLVSSADLPLGAGATAGAPPGAEEGGAAGGGQHGGNGPSELRPDKVASGGPGGLVGSGAVASRAVVETGQSARVEPLSPARYKVQFTASAQLREKLERLRALMSSSVPDGDLAAVIEAAVTEKLERLEARRFGRTKNPRPASGTPEVTAAPAEPSDAVSGLASGGPASGTSPATRHVPAEVRRAVYERDGGQCRYVDVQGRRCTARRGLELHHRHPWGYGGEHSLDNVCLLCKPHNRLMAETDYGRRAMARHRGRQGALELTPPSR